MDKERQEDEEDSPSPIESESSPTHSIPTFNPKSTYSPAKEKRNKQRQKGKKKKKGNSTAITDPGIFAQPSFVNPTPATLKYAVYDAKKAYAEYLIQLQQDSIVGSSDEDEIETLEGACNSHESRHKQKGNGTRNRKRKRS